MDDLWERVRAGRHTAVLGVSPGEPAAPPGVRVVRVRCDVPHATLGPLHEAQRKVERLLGVGAPLLGQARERVVQGLRRRFLGDVPAMAVEAALVEVYNRLAESSDQPAALVLEAIEAADDATLTTLRRVLSRPGWLKLPVVIAFRTTAPSGAAAALLTTLEGAAPGCVLRVEAVTALPDALAAAAPIYAWRALPPEVLRVLRAGALVGPGFEAELVAALLAVEPLDVLEALQRAADAGIPVEDLRDGRFHLPDALLDAVRASMLPSLMVAWHQRLALLLGVIDEEAAPPPDHAEGFAPTRRAAERELPTLLGAERAPAIERAPAVERLPSMTLASTDGDGSPTQRGAPASPAGAEPAPAAPGSAEPAPGGPGIWPYEELFARVAESLGAPATIVDALPAPPRRVVEPPAPSVQPSPRATEPPPTEAATLSRRTRAAEAGPRSASAPRADDARAAGHLAAAGELDAGAERYFAAAQQAAAQGAYPQAFACASKALAMLEALPAAPRRRRLRARALLELGRLKWQASGPLTHGADGGEPAFTLAGALEAVEAASSALTADDPPELAAEAAQLVAGICYDIGDLPALTRALEELTTASRILLGAGDATGAARLLNDQAAVYVRLGDPVRATHLLTESRKIFEERAAADPDAAVEMAETDHLFARIPLHVPARPGREADALTMGLDHALAAERAYRRLGARRELGRVWETMGRLELRKGRLDRARQRLGAAVEIEEAIGDLVGLARSTAALSELLAASGRPGEALALLSDSVALNVEKGSPIGLAFNRRALDALGRGAGPSAERAEVERRLVAAEAVLGRIKLAGEHD
jgi:tetratricopeptide (TPR) repeat protein